MRAEPLVEAVEVREPAAIGVRPAVESDLGAVIALDQRITGIAKPDYWRDLFERYQTRPARRFFLVAELPRRRGEAQLAGFIIGEVRAWEFGSGPCGWVFALNVDPKARLKGVGTILFEAIVERFRSLGIRRIRTMVARANQLMMSFFRSQGMMAGPYIELEKDLD